MNEALGVMPLHRAMGLAREAELDLVETVPNATPPVVRIVDYGKLVYQEQKKAQEQKSKQNVVRVKEIKLRPVTDDHDIQTKVKSMNRFLADGDKCKISIQFRGREMAHQELGKEVLNRIIAQLADVSVVEQAVKLEGRYLTAMLSPKKSNT